jgi:hypothetical protein
MALWRRLFGGEGDSRRKDLLTDLLTNYRQEVLLARQVRDHAEKAPYPTAGETLKGIAAEQERQARLLRERILSLGGQVSEVVGETKGGRNSWARLTHDLQDCQALQKGYIEQAIRWDPEEPEVVELLRTLGRETVGQCALLRDLALRSDPHALD